MGPAAVDRYGPCRALTLIPLFAAGEVVRVPELLPDRQRKQEGTRQEGTRGQDAAAKTADEAPAAKKAPAQRAAKKAPAKKTAKAAGNGAAAEVVVGPDGKKILPDIPDAEFEKDVATDPTLKEEEDESKGFVVSQADESDEPSQQVMVAGATADPVKDYLKQIGKVPLLNAEMEVELAKRIEAGLFSRRSSPRAARSRRSSRSSSGSPRTAAAPRTTCSRPTSGSSSRWPSATPAAACSSST
jgi:hypothetical protein